MPGVMQGPLATSPSRRADGSRCCRVSAGSAELDELPTDSLKHIKETYKAFKAVAGSWAAAAGHTGARSVAGSITAGQVRRPA